MRSLETKKDNKKTTQERVKELMKDSGKLQQDLADDVGYSITYFSAILNGRRPFPKAAAKRIAAEFPGVRWEWIMGLDDFKTKNDIIKARIDGSDFAYRAIEDLVGSFGFTFDADNEKDEELAELLAYEHGRELNISCYQPNSMISVFYRSFGIEGMVKSEIGSYPAHEVQRFFDEIIDFARFKFDRLMERADEDG